jgi:MFS family permease
MMGAIKAVQSLVRESNNMSRAYETKSNAKPDVVSFTQALNPIREPGAQAYVVWLVSLLFVLFQFLIQLSSGEILDGLMRSFSLTALGGGFLASAYYYIYVILQTPGGLLLDRFGPRRLLSTGAIVLMLGSALFSTTHFVALAFLGRLLMGGGAAFAFVGSLALLNRWFPKKRFSTMAGIAEMVGMLGTLGGGVLLAYLIEDLGWRDCMLGVAAIAGLIALLVWLLVRDDPPYRKRTGQRPKRRILPGLMVLLRIKVAWLNGLYSGLTFSVVTVFAALWAIPFVQAAYHLDLFWATVVCNMIFVGAAVGCPLLGWFDQHIPQRRFVMSGFALVSMMIMSLLIFEIGLPLWFLYFLFFILGVFVSSYMLTFAIANEIVATRIKSASIGFVNMLSVGLAPILQPLVGLILSLLTIHAVHNSVHHYTVHEYQIALSIIPLLLLVAAIIGWFLPNRRHH